VRCQIKWDTTVWCVAAS